MPSTRPTVDPVLDILEEMGYDFDELEGDGYKRSLKEAIIILTNKDAGDPRIGILIEEIKKVKKSRKVESKEKRTTIKGDKLMGKDAKKDAPSPITDKSKLLPGRGNFSADDIKSDVEEKSGEDKKDDVIAFLNGEVSEKLDTINADVIAIKESLVEANDLSEEKDEEIRQAIIAGKKKKREKDLEDKKGGLKDKLLESVTKPVGNFLNKLIRFVMMTFVGSVVNNILTLLKDPARLLDPIKKFFNLIIGMVNAVMRGLWKVTGEPLNFIIGGVNNGVKFLLDSLNKATAILKIPPMTAPEIPLVPGPPQFQFIPLSETAQAAKNEAVGMAGGGEVPEVEGEPGVDGEDGMIGAPGEDGVDGLSLPVDVNQREQKAVPEQEKINTVTPQKMSGGGVVPYNNPFVLGTGHNVIDTAPENIMGYNKGGKVPGSGNKDTVPAMLTPGEFVMSKGAVDQIGVDNLMAMNKQGGGTNKPKMMKFAGGGVVPDIDTPTKKGGKVVVIGGGGGSSAPRGVAASGSSGNNPTFSSTDPNNMTIPVVKSLYNIMS
tara:strand:+ start:1741 stop:3378 length:1638 start_codon:yes stop_codon:yes gene_type:complete